MTTFFSLFRGPLKDSLRRLRSFRRRRRPHSADDTLNLRKRIDPNKHSIQEKFSLRFLAKKRHTRKCFFCNFRPSLPPFSWNLHKAMLSSSTRVLVFVSLFQNCDSLRRRFQQTIGTFFTCYPDLCFVYDRISRRIPILLFKTFIHG